MANVYSDSTFRDAFLHGAARAFFTMAYANFVEDSEREPDGHDYPRPGGGEDWMDYVPPVPPNAYAMAGELWAGLEHCNSTNGVPACPFILAKRAMDADGHDVNPEDFGHYLAMMAMQTGVSWFDDNNEFPLEVPWIECHAFSFDVEAYRVSP